MTEEEELLGRVLDTLLREDAYKLRSRAGTVRLADGDWLRIGLEGGESVLLPVEPEGFQCDLRARRPPRLVQQPGTSGTADEPAAPGGSGGPGALGGPGEPGPLGAPAGPVAPGDPAGHSVHTVLTGLDAVLERLRAAVPDEDQPLYDAFVAECQQALDAMRLHTRVRPGVVAELAARHGTRWTGMSGAVAYDTLAAFRDHPVYPTSRGRAVFTEDQLRAHAPEFHPAFALRWLVLPREAVAGDPARLPDWWPTPAELGLGPGSGSGSGSGFGPGPGPGPGRGPGSDSGSGPGSDSGPGPGSGSGFGPGLGLGSGPARGPGPGFGLGRGPGLGPGPGPGRGPGLGPGPSPAPRSGPGRRPGLGPGPDPGRGPGSGRVPGRGPAPGPEPADGWLAFPVHPLTVGRPLETALRAAGLEGTARLAERSLLDVRPTLSMRTVAVAHDPLVHLKLPLTTSTLGLRNRRTVKPGTLIDGEVAQRLVEAVIEREPRFGATVLLADETTHLHAGHELLATLVRRYPPGLENATIVPLAGLLAPTPDGALVVDGIAERHYGGDVLALLDDYFTLLFDFHTTLFAYGIALESHQQNTSLVFEDGDAVPRLRLLIKDHDGPRVHAIRLAAVIGGGPAADLCGFDDRRILTPGDGPVADVFTTITVHLCAAAPVFELARLGRAPLDTLLRRLRDRLTEAVDRLAVTQPGACADLLRARVLNAERLPVKAMVTAGTLFTKERSGAADINKHYVTGPNYLRRGSGR
ncbi:IucA/IucC family protein [Streptomyces hygroscopicus]|uniref:IucA/IucC family protein n=1 Tax=Streptomyces hygroscopicus TaxID=1912 RepID=UPI001FC8F1F4|nr:IucA/IucC family protein [Streptomyces hygroscopicus]